MKKIDPKELLRFIKTFESRYKVEPSIKMLMRHFAATDRTIRNVIYNDLFVIGAVRLIRRKGKNITSYELIKKRHGKRKSGS